MKSEQPHSPTEVFAGSILDAEMVKSFLSDAGIEVYLYDSIVGTLAPWNTAPGGAGAVRVMVSPNDYEESRLLVNEYLGKRRTPKG